MIVNTVARAFLYSVFEFFDRQGLPPSQIAATLAEYDGDRADTPTAKDMLEEAAAYLERDEKAGR
jgi:hypothetical protein